MRNPEKRHARSHNECANCQHAYDERVGVEVRHMCGALMGLRPAKCQN